MTCILMIFDSSLEFRNTRYIFSIMHKYLSAHIFERYFFNCFSWFDGKPLHQPSELFGCEAFNYKSFDPVRSSSAEQVKRPCRCVVLYAERSEYSGKTVYTTFTLASVHCAARRTLTRSCHACEVSRVHTVSGYSFFSLSIMSSVLCFFVYLFCDSIKKTSSLYMIT